MKNLTWHIPLIAKEKSESQNCLFLAQKDNIFFMDNHLLALWCWQYFLNQNKQQFNFFHLDAHEDAKQDLEKNWWEKIQGISLQDYLSLKSPHGEYKLFRWDNYLPVMVHDNQQLLRKSVFATHSVGLEGFSHQKISAYNLLADFPKLFVDELPWIINLDLDYFYSREYKGSFLFDEKWIREFFKKLKFQFDQKDILLITVALSPECCGSWENSEKVLAIFDEYFQTGIAENLSKK